MRIGDDIAIQRDIRIVNGIRVDLGPVNRWLRDRQGERPMKHWKELQVYRLKGNVGGFDRCVVKIEDQDFSEVLVKNLPAEINNYFRVLNYQSLTITNLRAQIEFEEQNVEWEGAIVPIPPGVVINSLEDATNQLVHISPEAISLKEQKERLVRMEAEHEVWRNRGLDQTKVLAMPSGIKYANLPVWDCGARKQQAP